MQYGVNIIITDRQGRILILKRGHAETFCPNFWDLPGGKVENGESLLEAAKREAKEESGLDVKIEQNYFYVYHCQNVELDIYSFKASLVSGDILLSEEHNEFKWIFKDDWKNLKYTSSVKATIEQFFKN